MINWNRLIFSGKARIENGYKLTKSITRRFFKCLLLVENPKRLETQKRLDRIKNRMRPEDVAIPITLSKNDFDIAREILEIREIQ